MKNGIIYKSDGEKLFEIFNVFNLEGIQKRPLTTEEMELLCAIGKKIKEIGMDD